MILRKPPGAFRGRPCEPEKETTSLFQQLAETFREGVASAKPGSEKPSASKKAPPPQRERPSSDYSGKLDRVIQEGRSAAAVVGDKASSVLDSVVHLAKKTPALPTKWAEAFREGAASVRSGAGKAQRGPGPALNRPASIG